jgi:hypothetical protein
VDDGRWRGRYTASRRARAAPSECPVIKTFCEPVAACMACTAARTGAAELWATINTDVEPKYNRQQEVGPEVIVETDL